MTVSNTQHDYIAVIKYANGQKIDLRIEAWDEARAESQAKLYCARNNLTFVRMKKLVA